MTGENFDREGAFGTEQDLRACLLHCFCQILEAVGVPVTRREALLLVLACLLGAGNKKC